MTADDGSVERPFQPSAALDNAKLGAARLRLLYDRPYYAEAIHRLRVRIASGIKTFAVDDRWRLYVDPDAVGEWSVEQIAAVLEHELNHLLRHHNARAEMSGVTVDTAPIFNIAADAEINDDPLVASLPGSPVTPDAIGQSPGKLAEVYYEALRHQAGMSMGRTDCGSGSHGVPRPFEDPSDDDAVEHHEGELIRRSVATAVRTHQRVVGDVPAGVRRWAEKTLQPTVDWRRVLSAAVRHSFADVAGMVDYTYSKPSRRSSIQGDIVLPSLRAPVPRVTVILDTSGSMDGKSLDRALGEVRGVLRAVGHAELTVISCDAAAYAPQRVRDIRSIGLYGGGGTDMAAGLDAAHSERFEPDLVIVLTDGYTDWPSEPPRRRVRYVVSIIGDGPLGPAWARTVRLPAVETST